MQGFLTLGSDSVILVTQYGAVDLTQVRDGMLYQHFGGILERIIYGMGQFHTVLRHADTYTGT